MVELAQVRELMRGHVVDQMRRQHHQAPVEEYSPVGAAAPPAGLRVGKTHNQAAEPVRARELRDPFAEKLKRLPPHPIERSLAQARSVGEPELEPVVQEPHPDLSMPQRQGHSAPQPRQSRSGLPHERSPARRGEPSADPRSEEHTSELQSLAY